MSVWALADLHLALSVPEKNMSFFGPLWSDYMEKIAQAWREVVQPSDLVLLAGDISWAMHLTQASIDLKWIDDLPGTKVMIRGNHDYWWSSPKKMAAVFPPSIHFLHNTAFHWNDIAIGGTRLWDSKEYNFNEFVHFQENSRARPYEKEEENDEAIFERELHRLRLSLQLMNPGAKLKIGMTHYPPISADLKPSRASAIFEEFGVSIVVFGHLHNLKKDRRLFGTGRGIDYHLTACDYLDFQPLKLL